MEIMDKSKVADSFSNFFENAIRSLNIKANEHSQENFDLKNAVEIAVKKFNKSITSNESFCFTPEEWKNKTRVTSYEFKSTSYEFKSTSYEFKSTSYEFKSTS